MNHLEGWIWIGPKGLRFADRPRWYVGVLRLQHLDTNSALYPATEVGSEDEAIELRYRLSRGERGPE